MSGIDFGGKMTVSKQSNASGLETPEEILHYFMKCESRENNNLIEILGMVKPAKGSHSTLPSIIRGLCTKNTKLLSLLGAYTEEIVKSNLDNKQQFKNFINEFVIWIGDDFQVILEKYKSQIMGNASEFVTNGNLGLFAKPILHCNSYIEVIDSSIKILRNPFVIGKLISIKDKFRQIMADFENYQDQRNLNEISFENIQLFGDKNVNSNSDKVSSFFSTSSIVERSKNDPIFIVNTTQQTHCEFVLLKLSENIESKYDSLAILSILPDSNMRFLLFPPFRLNELAIKLDGSRLTLNLINFSNVNKVKNSIVIESSSDSILKHWADKLSHIFPLEENNSPVSESFLINPLVKGSGMTGLGINVVTDQDHKKSLSVELSTIIKNSENNNPNNANSGNKDENTIQSTSTSVGWDNLVMPINPGFKSRKNSSSSFHSTTSSDSIKSQYDRSLNIINKTFSNPPNRLELNTGTSYMKIVGKTCDVDEGPTTERPKSSRGEIKNINFPEATNVPSPTTILSKSRLSDNYCAKNLDKFSSVPDLSKPNKVKPLYELSSGSAVDVTNFGKNHTPTFSIPNNLTSLVDNQETVIENEPKQKKKLFNIFKKQSLKNLNEPNTPTKSTISMEQKKILNNKSKKIDGDNDDSNDDNDNGNNDNDGVDKNTKKQISFSTKDSNSSTLSNNLPVEQADKHVSMLPSPFALPSSTSMYFFKQYKNNSSSNILKDSDKNHNRIQEEDLIIPQHLKDLINQESSIDFFISTSEPKSLKFSKWKPNHGKWEMLTVNEKVFLKLVVNYEENKGWLIAYKEEYDEYYNEDVDKPIILLDLDDSNTSVRNSSALDLQISAVNSITSQKMQILVRCNSGDLSDSIKDNINNVLGVLASKFKHSMSHLDMKSSSFTISSSLMDHTYTKPSSAGTSYSSSLNEIENYNSKHKLPENNNNLSILNKSGYTKVLLLSQMVIRLQKQLESYDKIDIPSSWLILSMFELSIWMVSNEFESYYNFELYPINYSSKQTINFVINQDEKFLKLEKIGKAGLLIKNSDDDIYMIECKGKKELNTICKIL